VTSGGLPRLRGEQILSGDTTVSALRPRIEVGGRLVAGSIEVTAVRPDGSVEPILWIRDFSPHWQLPYVLRDPLPLVKGTRLVVSARTADRSAAADVQLLTF
jgi:hypothetical protein